MQIVKQSWEFLNEPKGEQILHLIEIAGRTCYKSEDKITPESSRTFVKKLIDSGHYAMIEHGSITVKIITDRGVTHEIVRHRIASYAQESTRYCNYGNDKFGCQITYITPVDFILQQEDFVLLQTIQEHYMKKIAQGKSPQQARYFLPNGLKTEIVMTANPREWRHFFTLRTSKAAHPQMRALALDMLQGFKNVIPVLFDDISLEVHKNEKQCIS